MINQNHGNSDLTIDGGAQELSDSRRVLIEVSRLGVTSSNKVCQLIVAMCLYRVNKSDTSKTMSTMRKDLMYAKNSYADVFMAADIAMSSKPLVRDRARAMAKRIFSQGSVRYRAVVNLLDAIKDSKFRHFQSGGTEAWLGAISRWLPHRFITDTTNRRFWTTRIDQRKEFKQGDGDFLSQLAPDPPELNDSKVTQ